MKNVLIGAAAAVALFVVYKRFLAPPAPKPEDKGFFGGLDELIDDAKETFGSYFKSTPTVETQEQADTIGAYGPDLSRSTTSHEAQGSGFLDTEFEDN